MALFATQAARGHIKNLLTAFSLGTLCFIRRWYDLENLQVRGLDYFRNSPANLNLLYATFLSALLLSAVFWGAWRWVELHPTPGRKRLAQCVFLLILMYPIESVRRYWNTVTDRFDYGSNISMWAIEAILFAGFILLLFGNTRILRPARNVAVWLTLLFPALMLDFTTSHLGQESRADYAPRPPASWIAVRAPSAPRVIWIVFDELDGHLPFDQRPSDLALPEIDRLQSASLVADHATQTSLWTAIALPSMLSGHIYSNAQAIDARTLRVWPEGSQNYVDWRNQPTVFSRAREMGVNAAVVGWHHPYCRILGDELAYCFALPSLHSTAALVQERQAAEAGVLATIPRLFWRQVYNVADMVHGGAEPESERLRDAEIQRSQQEQYFQIRDQAYRAAVDRRIGLLFLHFPTPHPYPIYNRRAGNFDLRGARDYFDNLALVDRTIGELRRALEQAGLWNQTALLITGDHGLRPANWTGHLGWTAQLDRLTGGRNPVNVAFLLKMGANEKPVLTHKEFSNVVSGDLSLAILRGEVKNLPEAVQWLDQHASGTDIAAAVS